MSFLEAIPESGQLFLLGSGLFLLGMLFRQIRRALKSFRAPLPTGPQPEARRG
jgi:hypothetical protein